METRLAVKRKRHAENEYNKRPRLASFFDNYQMVYLLMIHTIPFLNKWDITRLRMVSTTMRRVLDDLKREIVLWCGSIKDWIVYYDDEFISRRIIHQSVDMIDCRAIISAQYYKTLLAKPEFIKIGFGYIVTHLIHDTGPVDDIFKQFICKLMTFNEWGNIVSEFQTRLDTISSDVQITEKCTYTITMCNFDDMYMMNITTVWMLSYMLDNRMNCVTTRLQQYLRIYSDDIVCLVMIYEKIPFDIIGILRISTFSKLLRNADLLERVLSRIQNPLQWCSDAIHEIYTDNTTFMFEKHSEMVKVLSKYVTLEELDPLFLILKPGENNWEMETIAILANDLDYIDRLYSDDRYSTRQWNDINMFIGFIHTFDMFIRVWNYYKIDPNAYLRRISQRSPYNYCSESVLLQILYYIRPVSLSAYYQFAFYDKRYARAILQYEMQYEYPEEEAIRYLSKTLPSYQIPWGFKDKHKDFIEQLSFGDYLAAESIYRSEFQYSLGDIRITTKSRNNESFIFLVKNITSLGDNQVENMHALITVLESYKHWSSVLDCIVSKFPGALSNIRQLNAAIHGMKTFIMKRLKTYKQRLVYLTKCQTDISVMHKNEVDEIYYLSLQYKIPMVDNNYKCVYYS
jgi:hypothetical protein